MLSRSLVLSAAVLVVTAQGAFAASCPKADKKWFDAKISSYSMCLSKKATQTPGMNRQSAEQIAAFFDQQTQCKQGFNQAMGYVAQMSQCSGKPMTAQQLNTLTDHMQKNIYAVLIKDVQSP